MIKTGQIKLSVNELVATLALCGYDKVASQIINEQNLISEESEFESFIQQSETLLRQKGYWDDDRDTNIAKGLEDLLHLLVNSSKKIRCVNMNKRNVLLIHSLNRKTSLIQEVNGNEHAFSFHENHEGYSSILSKHYGLEMTNNTPDGIQPIQISDQMFDELHNEDAAVLNAMAQDESQDASLRLFLKDFLRNGQELDNMSFMISEYVKDQSSFDQIVFLLPSDNMIWHLDYENVENHELFIVPVSVGDYFKNIESSLLEFLG